MATGVRLGDVAIGVGRSKRFVQLIVSRSAGSNHGNTVRSTLRLSSAEREEISRGLRAGDSLRRIAVGLGRPPSTVSREVASNGGRRAIGPCSTIQGARSSLS